MLLAGSADGVVRVWQGFTSMESLKLVTAWRALPISNESSASFSNLSTSTTSTANSNSVFGSDLFLGAPSSHHRTRGMQMDWQQSNGLLMTSGEVPFIRIWDIERELSIQDISTGSNSPVTSLTNDKSSDGRTIVAGFGDGSIRTFDSRLPHHRFSPSATFSEHDSWIVNASVPKNDYKIISGGNAGDAKFWDPRNSKCSTNTLRVFTTSMSALSIHDYAPLLACGSPYQKIKVVNFQGEELSMIRFHFGFLGQRIGQISCLNFHPYKLVLSAGASDSIISIYESTS